MPRTMHERLTALGQYVAANENTITNALEIHARRMTKAATKAQEAWQAGRADPEVKAAQDATLVTNDGYRQTAIAFRESAEAASRALATIRTLSNSSQDTD